MNTTELKFQIEKYIEEGFFQEAKYLIQQYKGMCK